MMTAKRPAKHNILKYSIAFDPEKINTVREKRKQINKTQ